MLRIQRKVLLNVNQQGRYSATSLVRLFSSEVQGTSGKKTRAPYITSDELIEQWKEKSIGVHKKLAEIPQTNWRTMYNELFEAVAKNLKSGKDVTVQKFGTFRVRKSGESKRRNPRSGAEIIVPPKDRLRFKASPKFMEEKADKPPRAKKTKTPSV